jgi:hypothetical protein
MQTKTAVLLAGLSVLIAGCGPDDWSAKINGEFDEFEQHDFDFGGITPMEIRADNVIRALPAYYRAIGAMIPKSSMEAALFGLRDEKIPVARMLNQVNDGVMETIIESRERPEVVVPYPPIHTLMAFLKQNQKDCTRDGLNEYCPVQSNYIRDKFFFLWQYGRNTKTQVIFDRLYESLAEYFRIQHYGYDSHMLAIEFLEREPFEALKIFLRYVPGRRFPELLDKLRDCLSNGLSNYKEKDKEALVQIIAKWITYEDELQKRIDSNSPDFKTVLGDFADWLESQESVLDRLLKMSN